MRIIQTINDTIRLLFNPKTEVFYLSDFLLVRDVEENFLGQVIEVYDDKFDQEANVAKIKLIYRIVNGNELVPYDNYTPSRECEVAKIKQGEIEKCINLNKKVLTVGKDANTGDEIKINTNFFENNCVIFADKFEQTNKITECLAPKLSSFKNVLVLDFSGACELEGAHAFCAGEDFKMPLSASTIDYIQQKTLLRAKLETQIVLSDVFEEVKNFLLESQDGYLPFSRFIKVVQGQCKQTPSVELLVLISWLRKYSRLNIFAKTKKEFEPFFKSLEKNKITTLDVSNIKSEWQKEFVEYIVNTVQNDIFVLVRLNDNNINNDIINSVYLKKKNVSFIPSFSYGYKKASYIMEFAQNYILLPTLNPKRDFNHANFQIQALNNESFMLFGENTKDFIFVLELKSPIKKVKRAVNEESEEKDKLFISLNLQLDEMTPLELHPSNFEIKTTEGSKRKKQEEIMLADVLAPEAKQEVEEETAVEIDTVENPDTVEEQQETIEPEQNNEFEDTSLVSMADEDILGEDELDYFEVPEENAAKEVINETEEIEPVKAVDEAEEEKEAEVVEAPEAVETPDKEIVETVEEKEAPQPEEKEETIVEEEPVEAVEIEKEVEEPVLEEENNELQVSEVEEIEAEIIKQVNLEKEEEKQAQMPKIKEIAPKEEIKEEEPVVEISPKKNELLELAKENEDKEEKEEKPADEIDDNILDAIDEVNGISVEVKEEPAVETTTIEEVVKEQIESAKAKQAEKEEKEEVKEETKEDLKKEVKEKSAEEAELDKKFDEILSEENEAEVKKEMLKIDDKNSIDLEKIKEEIKNPEHKLPVFDDENENASGVSSANFTEGNKVSHAKYGTGEILKVIKHGARCLLQIEFPEIGKRLLDPKIAKLTIVKED